MGYEHCKHCDEHLIECDGGACDWCANSRTENAVEEAVAHADEDKWGTFIDEVAPDTPVRMWLRRDKKTGKWFARVNVGGWQRGESADALRESPTRAIAAALARVLDLGSVTYAGDDR